MQPRISALVALSIGALACGGGNRNAARDGGEADLTQDSPSAATGQTIVTASMRNAAGKDLGMLTLTDAESGISASGRLTGLSPGVHAIHLHTAGKCEGPKFQSAGDHWNPTTSKHGTQSQGGPHLGDMPNITVGRDSSVSVQASTRGGSLRGSDALLDADGAAVVIHSKRDDYKTQPSGDSGDRIACGVVTSGS